MSLPIIIHPRNPDHAVALFHDAVILGKRSISTDSRNGPVIRADAPVITVWDNPPRQMFSTSAVRDANPFFHYLEAMWMLAGRCDVAYPGYIAKQILEYSDNGQFLNGAYGHRWVHWFGKNQLERAANELRDNPANRRVVVSMWDGHRDLVEAKHASKDHPCNLQLLFDVVKGKLNMTITNRSNDMIWGAYGANVVHMSILLEYISALSGIQMGTMYQFSNNAHVYPAVPVVQRCLEACASGDMETDISWYPVPCNLFISGAPTTQQINDVLWKPGEFPDKVMSFEEADVWSATAWTAQNLYWTYKNFGVERAVNLFTEMQEAAPGNLFSLGHSTWINMFGMWLDRRLEAKKAKEV